MIIYGIVSDIIVGNIQKHWILIHEAPKEIINDQGRQYISKKFIDFATKYSIKHTTTSPYNPTANGISERLNQTISTAMRMFKNEAIENISRKLKKRLNFNNIVQQDIRLMNKLLKKTILMFLTKD